ncbi:hypothetical protein FRB94_009229 [Tulasnella sp. JGI-2019a]|nr:hypothetical protein FRB94_009229 [Tulasnella sp. JGI-2019a]KAG9016486.1 hypothetical protein FRB93_010735 [Tulasnella sp. JGI-2019a]KAG9030572.1 hypothetical protein FRB95_003833 [Tulasnella sp. JGI-2019a]
MIIQKKHRKLIYERLFQEGVLVAKKDLNAPKHDEIEEVKNLHVIKAMQSLTSRGFVKTQFSWQYYYYTLTNEGLEYMREWLHLPAEIVPNTHKKQVRAPKPGQGRDGAYRAPRGDREGGGGGYGRDKEGGAAPGEFKPRYAGVGRGAPRGD